MFADRPVPTRRRSRRVVVTLSIGRPQHVIQFDFVDASRPNVSLQDWFEGVAVVATVRETVRRPDDGGLALIGRRSELVFERIDLVRVLINTFRHHAPADVAAGRSLADEVP